MQADPFDARTFRPHSRGRRPPFGTDPGGHSRERRALPDRTGHVFQTDPARPAPVCAGGILPETGREIYDQRHFLYMIPTPGHTKGSVCYLFEDHLFTGDTLFRNSIGTTDFGGDRDALNNSLRMLCRLPGDYTIYPGHESMTSLSEEIRNNPFIRSLRRN
ncbi:MAG: MBL fold metallo-hydrolase [Clostridia bacterium]|nr:MBL fold metallo-hydrolase [Clostridia bacterium]